MSGVRVCHPGEGRGPRSTVNWIPAFAGMTRPAETVPYQNIARVFGIPRLDLTAECQASSQSEQEIPVSIAGLGVMGR